MKSREERKAERLRKDAESKAKYEARMAEIKATHERRMGEIRDKAEARRRVVPDVEPGAVEVTPPVYTPSALGVAASMVVPGLGAFQAAKYYKTQKAFLESLTPEQRAEYIRRMPTGSSGG